MPGQRQARHASRPRPGATLRVAVRRALCALPMLLVWEREHLADLGEAVAEEGVRVRRLKVDLGAGLRLMVEIDRESARIRRSAG